MRKPPLWFVLISPLVAVLVLVILAPVALITNLLGSVWGGMVETAEMLWELFGLEREHDSERE